MTWPKPCVNAFTKMAAEEPDRLLEWVASGTLDAADLSFALEQLGTVKLKAHATLAQMALLHDSPLVREGAVLGIANARQQLNNLLERVADSDPSPGVRKSAKESLAP